MDKKLINEDIKNMKYLLGYKPGRVISEQEYPELGENNPFRNNNGLDEYDFPEELKDRLNNIYDLLDEVMNDPEYNPSDYSDMFDYSQDVIGGVLFRLFKEFGDKFEEYDDDIDDYLRNNEDEYIFNYYISNTDFEDEDELDEDMFDGWDDPDNFKSTLLTKRHKLDLDDEDEDEGTLFEQEGPKTDRYMFFSNLEQIHRQTGILLEKDPEMISEILDNGHDWAQDHIATSKETIDQVFDFLMNEENDEGNEDFEDKMM